MASDGKVVIGTELDKKGFETGLQSMGSSADRGLNIIKSAMTAVGVAAIAAGTALSTIGFNYNKQMEEASAAFKVLLGSADLAKSKLAELEKFANNTPFDLPGVAKAAKTLLAYGTTADDLMPILKNLGDISLGNNENFQSLALAFGQVQAKGKLAGQELLQMVNTGFNPLQFISQKTGETMDELAERMSKGAISVDEVKQAMIDATAEGGRFNGAMDEYAKTFQGRWSTAMDALGKLSGEILKPMYNFIKDNLLPVVIDFMTQLTLDLQQGNWNAFLETIKAIGFAITVATAAMIGFKAGAIIQSVIQSFQLAQVSLALYTATAQGATIAQGVLNGTLTVWETLVALLTGKITIATFVTGLWTKAQAALNAVLLANPIGIVVAIIAVLVAAIIYLWTTNEGFRKAVIEIWNKIVQVFKDSAKWIVDTWNATVAWFQSLPAKFKAIVDAIVRFFTELPSRIWIYLVETFHRVVAWISNLQSKINSAIPALIANIINWFAQLPGKMASIGADIVKGIWNGIAGAASWLYNKVASFCRGLLSGMMKSLGEHSPSKITAGYGKYLAQGLGVGFGDEIGNVYKDMNNAIGLQHDKLNWSVQAGSSYNNIMRSQAISVNGSYTSTILLDGEKVATSVNNINDRRSLQYGY